MLKLTGYILGTTGIAVGDTSVIYRDMRLKGFPGDLWEFDFYPNPKAPSSDVTTWILDVFPEPTRPGVKFENNPARILIETEALKHVFVDGHHEVSPGDKGWFFKDSAGIVYGKACFYGNSYGRITKDGSGWFHGVSSGRVETGGKAWFCDQSWGQNYGGTAWFFGLSRGESHSGVSVFSDNSDGKVAGGDASFYHDSTLSESVGGTVRRFKNGRNCGSNVSI